MKIVSKQVYINRAIVNVKTFCAQYLHAIACFVAHLQCNLKKNIHLNIKLVLVILKLPNFEIRNSDAMIINYCV